MEQFSASKFVHSPPGTWLLKPGEALTLRPRRAGILRVAGGSLWATGDGPHAGAANSRGDQLLEAGDRVQLRAGQRLVIEPLPPRSAAHFSWEPLPQGRPLGRPGHAAEPAAGWRAATAFWAGALMQLAAAVGGRRTGDQRRGADARQPDRCGRAPA